MKKYQNTLLAGVAALALIAGTGLASAQQSNEHMGGAGGAKAGSPQAGQSMNRGGMQSQAQEKGKGTQTQAQERGSGAQTQAQEKGKGTETQAQEKGNANANQTARTGQETGNTMGKRGPNSNAQAERMNRGSKNSRQNTAERQRTMKGLQGNASKPMQGENQQGSNPQGNTSNQAEQKTPQNGRGAEAKGGNVQLSEQQRTQIRETVINGHNAPRIGHVDFDVRVGTVIPRGRIHIVPVPETLVRIEPRWHGFLYFVYEDEVVIVNPRNMHIVAVIAA